MEKGIRMHCAQCGIELSDGSRFCPECGAQNQANVTSQQQSLGQKKNTHASKPIMLFVGKAYRVLFFSNCIATIIFVAFFNRINVYLISNGYYPIPSYYIIVQCFVILTLIICIKLNPPPFIFIRVIVTVIISAYVCFQLLFRIYDDLSYSPQHELVTPLKYMIFITVLVWTCLILWWLIRYQSKEANEHSKLITISIILLGISVPFAFYHDKTWISQFYFDYVDNIIYEATQTSTSKCNDIPKMYFKFIDGNYRYYHPYVYKESAFNLCKTASTSVRKDDYQYCFNDELIEHLKQKSDTNYNSAKVFELRTDKMLDDALICLSVYRKHRPEQSDKALEYVRNVLVDTDWAVDDYDFQTECRNDYSAPTPLCEYLTIENQDDH